MNSSLFTQNIFLSPSSFCFTSLWAAGGAATKRSSISRWSGRLLLPWPPVWQVYCTQLQPSLSAGLWHWRLPAPRSPGWREGPGERGREGERGLRGAGKNEMRGHEMKGEEKRIKSITALKTKTLTCSGSRCWSEVNSSQSAGHNNQHVSKQEVLVSHT